MTYLSAGPVTVERLRRDPAGTDQYGDPVPGPWQTSPLPTAWYAPGGSTEPVAASTADVVDTGDLYWRGRAPDVRATDRLRVNGQLLEVAGTPQAWPKGLHVPVRAIRHREE